MEKVIGRNMERDGERERKKDRERRERAIDGGETDLQDELESV